jgi:translation initiation factor 2B subunit (eIF-2B alpha/beta/delta family)
MKEPHDLLVVSSHRRAREVMRYFERVVDASYSHLAHYSDFVRALKSEYDALIAQIPLDGVTLNCLYIVFPTKRVVHFDSMQKLYEYIKERLVYVTAHLDLCITKIPELGSFKVKEHVFVFGHEHDVLNTLLTAYTKGVQFEVHITEQRSTLTGSLFAAELHKHGIIVHFYADAAMRQAIKKCDIVFIGAHAIDYSLKVYTTIGAELTCVVAQHYKKPVYIITDSWAFSRVLESQTDLTQFAQNHVQFLRKSQVDAEQSLHFISQWNVPQGVMVHYFSYEKISARSVTGIISELGILTPADFFMKVKQQYDSYF